MDTKRIKLTLKLIISEPYVILSIIYMCIYPFIYNIVDAHFTDHIVYISILMSFILMCLVLLCILVLYATYRKIVVKWNEAGDKLYDDDTPWYINWDEVNKDIKKDVNKKIEPGN